MDDDDDNGNTGGGGRGEAAAPTGPAMGPLYQMWENSLEKLKILNYETKFCAVKGKKMFNRVHFIVAGPNASNQFDDFVDICAWLFLEISKSTDMFKKEQFDDPTTVANKLMLGLRQLDFRSSFPSQKLKTPFGESVCTVLDFLTDKALTEKGFKWGAPVYNDSNEVEQAVVDDEADGDVEEEGAAVDDDALFHDSSPGDPDAETSIDASTHNILQSAVDPVIWKTELERVGPKLKNQQPLSANEWRAHVDQTITSKEHIDKVLGETQTDLQLLNKGVTEELGRMRTKEKYMNNQYTAICTEYRDVKKQLEDLVSKSTSTNETVARLTNEMSELSDKLEEMKETFESKDSGINDTSPLVRIKSSLQQIKAEIYSFDLRIGVVSHSLLAARVNAVNMKRLGTAQKAKKLRANSKMRTKKDADATNDDDSLLSGDE